MDKLLPLAETVKDPDNWGDVYQLMTYLVLIVISMFVMAFWLKRRGRRKNNKR